MAKSAYEALLEKKFLSPGSTPSYEDSNKPTFSYADPYQTASEAPPLAMPESKIDYNDPVYKGIFLDSKDMAAYDSEGIKKEAGSDMGKDAGKAMADASSKGGGLLDIAGAGAMSTGHPVGIALGGAAMTLSALNKEKKQDQMDRYKVAVARQQEKQQANSKLASIGQGLRV